MRFASLTIDGFKSFGGEQVVPLPAGLVGVIGANGHGKSNVTEALRWLMGGVSARALRGSDMASVIFGGTAMRAARSHAEVRLEIEDEHRTLPAPWTGRRMDVTRRVVRGAKHDVPAVSTYRIDGEVVSAAEVQQLFAFAGTGSGSSALVRQGRIAELIAARAQDRRSLLEEAAGVAGVDQRRREADRRLDAAERDLLRQADLIAEIEARRTALEGQATTARRHAELTDRMQMARGAVLAVRMAEAAAREVHVRGRIAEADERIIAATIRLDERKAALAEAMAASKACWRTTGERADAMRRAEAAYDEAAQLLDQTVRAAERARLQAEGHARDAEREAVLADEASAAAAEAAARVDALRDQDGEDGSAADLRQLRDDLATVREGLTAARADLEAAVVGAAAREAETRALRASVREAELSAIDASLRADQARTALAALGEPPAIPEGGSMRAAEEASRANHALSVLQAERTALLRLLRQAGEGAETTPGVRVAPGLEEALVAALGPGLTAVVDSSDGDDAVWTALGRTRNDAALPKGTTPLSQLVEAPPELTRLLSSVGLLADTASGSKLVTSLSPGQVLVSRRGDAWRWDGLALRGGAGSAAAATLGHRTRLAEIESALPEAEVQAAAAHAARKAAEQAERDAEAHAAARGRADEAAERSAAAKAAFEAARQAAATSPGQDDPYTGVAALREVVARAEQGRDAAAAALAAAEGEAKVRAERLAAPTRDRDGWTERAKAAQARAEAAARQREQTEQQLARYDGAPERLTAKRDDAAGVLDAARAAHHEAQAAGEGAQAALRSAEDGRREAQGELTAAQAERAKLDAGLAEVVATLGELRSKATADHGTDDQAELLACYRGTEATLGTGGGEETEPHALPDRRTLTAELRRLDAEREALGPVNLAATRELAALDERLSSMRAQRQDVEQAVRRLRAVTADLERAARERVTEAYGVVAANFERLFAFLFGGGEARLELVGDDPLDAGLEVMAQPPGKQLTSLSLLSGGEQTLTALALVMAVFQARPAPVCVLDEVDAPLDRGNVERYCRLLKAVAADAKDTCFLVVTHHPVTTASMDYLCAVSMDEPGVTSVRMRKVPTDGQRAGDARANDVSSGGRGDSANERRVA